MSAQNPFRLQLVLDVVHAEGRFGQIEVLRLADQDDGIHFASLLQKAPDRVVEGSGTGGVGIERDGCGCCRESRCHCAGGARLDELLNGIAQVFIVLHTSAAVRIGHGNDALRGCRDGEAVGGNRLAGHRFDIDAPDVGEGNRPASHAEPAQAVPFDDLGGRIEREGRAASPDSGHEQKHTCGRKRSAVSVSHGNVEGHECGEGEDGAEPNTAVADNEFGWALANDFHDAVPGVSQCPERAELKMASMTAMLAMPSSRGTGTGVPSRMALENASPCSVYWSTTGKVSVLIPEKVRSPVESMKMRVGRSGGALKGISISMRPFVPRN